MAKTFEDRLCDILVKNKAITQAEAKVIHKEFHGSSKEVFDTFLLSEDIVQKEDLLKALSDYYEVPSFDAEDYSFENKLLQEFPQDVLLRHAIIPLKRDEDCLIIVASRPDNEDVLPELAEFVSDDIQFHVGIDNHIVDAIMEFYDAKIVDTQAEMRSSEEFQDEPYVEADMFQESEEDEEELYF